MYINIPKHLPHGFKTWRGCLSELKFHPGVFYLFMEASQHRRSQFQIQLNSDLLDEEISIRAE